MPAKIGSFIFTVNMYIYGDYNIAVTLRYQTMSSGFAQDLYKDLYLAAVALMKALDNNTTNHFETISTDTTPTLLP